MIKAETSICYLKAHLFKSTQSAVNLVEKNNTPDNIRFARKLLEIKNSQAELKLNTRITYNNIEMKHSDKYAQLISKVNNLELENWAMKVSGGGVRVLNNRPESGYANPVVWRSASHPGKFGVYIPGKSPMLADNLVKIEELLKNKSVADNTNTNTNTNTNSVPDNELNDWAMKVSGGGVRVLNNRPEPGYANPAVWRSASHPGKFGVHIPGKSPMLADNLVKIEGLLVKKGVLIKNKSPEDAIYAKPDKSRKEKIEHFTAPQYSFSLQLQGDISPQLPPKVLS